MKSNAVATKKSKEEIISWGTLVQREQRVGVGGTYTQGELNAMMQKYFPHRLSRLSFETK